MKCYIYFIINQTTKKRYVGQTTNFSRRKSEHLEKLRKHAHINIKLQAAFDKYGENDFIFEKICYDNLTKEQLDEQEKYYINYYNSRENGYNIAEGGTGGDTKSKLNFEQFCFAYFGNLKYKGMTVRTGKYLGVDSACISSIIRKKSYDTFREKADTLPENVKDSYILQFEQVMDIKNNPPPKRSENFDKDTMLRIFCVASTYSRGIESRILKYFNRGKGMLYQAFQGNNHLEAREEYRQLNKEQVQTIGRQYYQEWDLNRYGSQLKEKYTNLIEKYNK